PIFPPPFMCPISSGWRAVWRALFAAVCLSLTLPLSAQTIWSGAADNSWSNPANWSLGVPSSTLATPSNITFSTNDANGDVLTLDGTYYVNQFTIEKLNYGVTEKSLMNTGTEGSKLVFVANGAILPTLNLTMLLDSEPTSPTDNTPRSLLFGANIEIADDLTLTRTGGIGSVSSPYNSRFRRIFFDGVISGDGKLTINSNSTSNAGHIAFRNHNTFTGDIDMQNGYLLQTYADSLGAADKLITFGATGNVTWDMTSTSIVQGDSIGQDIALPSVTSRYVLFNAGNAQRQLIFSGDITGSASHTATQRSVHLIGQRNEQLIFTGETMTFGGQVYARYDTEFVVAAGNASGVAWENVKSVYLNQEVATTTAALSNNSAFLLRGDLTFNGPIEIADGESTAGTPARDIISIGQVNDQGTSTSFDATFTGKINNAENDYRSLNLVAESGGSATFTGDVLVAGGQGLFVNRIINSATSGGSLHFYEATPTGTVIIGSAGRIGQASTGTATAGTAEIQRGTLLVNTTSFYAPVEVQSGARLGGTGTITGLVSVLTGGKLEPGSGTTSPSFTSEIGTLKVTGDVTLNSGASLILQVAGPTFNIGSTAIVDVPTVFAANLDDVGNHDHLSLTGSLSVTSPGTIQYSPVGDYIISAGDAFHLLDFASLSLGTLTTDQVFSLPDVSLLNPDWSWNYSLFADYGLLVITTSIVPEPSRAMLLCLGLIWVGGARRRR
ncbi:MAG: PEP-CTERM sorting domain-containing protein, partial [Prosthecobacter sp.]|nr:PEP-CTERM sorting domain-containing protein [Prosthecobacter sp.]